VFVAHCGTVYSLSFTKGIRPINHNRNYYSRLQSKTKKQPRVSRDIEEIQSLNSAKRNEIRVRSSLLHSLRLVILI